jgi:hypothetical protein
VTLERYSDERPPGGLQIGGTSEPASRSDYSPQHLWDFAVQREGKPHPEIADGLRFPHWAAMVLFAVWPGLRAVGQLREHHRRVQARCPQCGYDLRAMPDRCPGCGAAKTPA